MKAASFAPCFGDKWAVIKGGVIIRTEAGYEICFFLDKASDSFSILTIMNMFMFMFLVKGRRECSAMQPCLIPDLCCGRKFFLITKQTDCIVVLYRTNQ